MGTFSRMNLCEMIGITVVLTDLHSSFLDTALWSLVYRNHCVWGGQVFAASIF